MEKTLHVPSEQNPVSLINSGATSLEQHYGGLGGWRGVINMYVGNSKS